MSTSTSVRTAPSTHRRSPGIVPGSDRGQRRQFGAATSWSLPFLVLFLACSSSRSATPPTCRLFEKQLIGGTIFVGLDNYVRALTDPLFLSGVAAGGRSSCHPGAGHAGLALFFALALDSGLLRLARVRPAGHLRAVRRPERGRHADVGLPLRAGLRPVRPARPTTLGLRPATFLSSDRMLGRLANIVTWEFIGYNMIILYAALRAIPHELYEAAAVDGAGPSADRLVASRSRRCGRRCC